MGRNIFSIPFEAAPQVLRNSVNELTVAKNGHFFIAFGLDAVAGGYFLQAGWDCEDSHRIEEVCNHPKFNGGYIEIAEIGFFQGVNKTKILTAMENLGVIKLVKTHHPGAFNNLCLDLPC